MPLEGIFRSQKLIHSSLDPWPPNVELVYSAVAMYRFQIALSKPQGDVRTISTVLKGQKIPREGLPSSLEAEFLIHLIKGTQ